MKTTDITHFDVIGDVHGCYYELLELITLLGYQIDGSHPEGRTLVFVGDITDRGFYSSLCLQWLFPLWEDGKVLWVRGNHDDKLFRWMKGNPVKISHGLERTTQELMTWPFEMPKEELGAYLLSEVPTQIELDHGNVIVVHAYPTEKESLRMYGPKSGDNRVEWWKNWRGPQKVVFGHYWMEKGNMNKWWCCVDTCCVKGRSLSALRYPEWEMVSVPAFAIYYRD